MKPLDIDSTLQTFEHFGVKLGLESIQQLLSSLGNPQQRVPIIHVAGSNGKGSVCAYLSAVLTEAGYRVGRYTSPHLIDWNERICLNEQPISSKELSDTLQQVLAAIDPTEASPTQFEVITAAAWLYFAQQAVDIAVIEVGLGGRLDATNVCDRPLVSVITSISREHWQRLGPTLADIAREKAGILKPHCPAVIGQLPPEAKAVVDRQIATLKCSAIYPHAAIYSASETETEPPHTPHPTPYTPRPAPWAIYQDLHYPLPLNGAIQLHNSALAIAALQILRQQGWQISNQAIVNGMANTKWAGRLQWFTWQNQKILIDGAHNPASAEVLRQFVDSLAVRKDAGERIKAKEQSPTLHAPRPTPHAPPTHWVIGMLSTKDHADIFKALLRAGDRLYLIPVPDHSSADPEALAKLAVAVCPTLADCQIYPDVMTALKAATDYDQESTNHATENHQVESLTVLCGSLYLIGHFFKVAASSR